jgi:hypothetical protein
VTTLIDKVHANRFAIEGKEIITFYNENWRSVDRLLLDGEHGQNTHVVDLWGEAMLDEIGPWLEPRDIGVVGIFPRLISSSWSGPTLHISGMAQGGADELEVVAVTAASRTKKRLPPQPGTQDLDVSKLFGEAPEKLIVKLKKDGIVLDMMVLKDIPPADAEGSAWLLSRR